MPLFHWVCKFDRYWSEKIKWSNEEVLALGRAIRQGDEFVLEAQDEL